MIGGWILKKEAWEELIKDLAAGLVRFTPMLFGASVPIPVGLIIFLSKKYNEYFSEDFFRVSVNRVHAQITHNTSLLNDVRSELKYDRGLIKKVRRGEVGSSEDLLNIKVNQLEEELELLEDKNIVLNLALMVRERSEFYEREFGKGIWKKISDYPSDVWRDRFRKTLEKYDEKRLNMKVFQDFFLKNIEKSMKSV